MDGQEKPISFTSFSLNAAQRKYPILHLEALALVCTVKKFHKFLFGQKFTIFTDHKPLLGIFGKEGKNQLCVTRLQRYVMDMAIYDYDILYRPSAQMGNADFCSRFPLDIEVPKCVDSGSVKSINFFSDFPIDYSLIAKETKVDDFLSKIAHYVTNGWPQRIEKDWKRAYSLRFDLEVVEGCLLYQDRVFVPFKLHGANLKLLHSNHIGIVKMKQIARRCLFWLGINDDIEWHVKQCQICLQTSVIPKPTSSTSWTPTDRPFSRIHADFFHFDHRTFLLVVDSYSKWLEIDLMKTGTDASKVIRKFTAIFARFGLPDVLVTDGGPPFNASQFTLFMERQGIKVLKSPPYNPSSNGQAERMVRVAKDVFKKFLLDPSTKTLDIEDRITYFLCNYRNTTSGDDEKFPSERVFSFKPKTLTDLLHPKRTYKEHLIFPKTKDDIDEQVDISCGAPSQDQFLMLNVGDNILYKNHDKNALEKWIIAQYVARVSTNIYRITIGRNTLNAHRSQLKLMEKRPTGSRMRIPIQRVKRPRESSDSEEEFLGFPDVPAVPGRPEDDRSRFKQLKRSPIVTRSKSRTETN